MTGKCGTVDWMLPSTTSPFSFTKIRPDTRVCRKCKPKGLTQKWSSRSASLAVMCPGHTFIEAELGKKAESGGQTFLTVLAFR